MTALSWAWTSASGPGAYGDAVRLERVEVVGRHVLVVEGDHAGASVTRRSVGRSV